MSDRRERNAVIPYSGIIAHYQLDVWRKAARRTLAGEMSEARASSIQDVVNTAAAFAADIVPFIA